ncbi:MAG: hypothetical protein ACPGVO_06215 [Spirulinaceae cyanobacterium]
MNKTVAWLGAGLMSAAGLLAPSAAVAEDTYTVSDDLMTGCVADGLSEEACECIIGEISDETGITEFDIDNIDGAIGDYIEVQGGDGVVFGELVEDCAAEFP